jgi:hypothetical protein
VDVKTGFGASEVFCRARAAGMHSGDDATLITAQPFEVSKPRIQDCYELLLEPIRKA